MKINKITVYLLTLLIIIILAITVVIFNYTRLDKIEIKEKVNEIADLNHAKENIPETSTLGWLGITMAIAHREKQVRSARAEKTKRITTHE